MNQERIFKVLLGPHVSEKATVLADGQTLSQGSGVYEIVPGFILSWLAIWLVSMMGKPPSEDIQSTFEAVRQALHRKGELETPR